MDGPAGFVFVLALSGPGSLGFRGFGWLRRAPRLCVPVRSGLGSPALAWSTSFRQLRPHKPTLHHQTRIRRHQVASEFSSLFKLHEKGICRHQTIMHRRRTTDAPPLSNESAPSYDRSLQSPEQGAWDHGQSSYDFQTSQTGRIGLDGTELHSEGDSTGAIDHNEEQWLSRNRRQGTGDANRPLRATCAIASTPLASRLGSRVRPAV
ncbi:hypothetical protein PCASD_11267 [Puccinia coronata f. sp. avenae]|uniref:Uncharacterized protein n=1 Tax=Puccinia coronata f. sp. avenae TaxID=200324 RepID=A0A2N5UJ23_9BASI|nr:hypothetical protein PCASD_11267 [Puccinia coronata f. sp. avenae]